MDIEESAACRAYVGWCICTCFHNT